MIPSPGPSHIKYQRNRNGKNTYMAHEISRVWESVHCSVMSKSLWCHELYPTRLLCPWNSPGKNTGVGCHFLLQGIFPTQGSNPPTQGWNPDVLHCRQILYCLSHQGSPWDPQSNLWDAWAASVFLHKGKEGQIVLYGSRNFCFLFW